MADENLSEYLTLKQVSELLKVHLGMGLAKSVVDAYGGNID